MREDELFYFSEEEFALMMELSGGKEYSLFLSNPKIDECRLTEAFFTLFQRGFIVRTADSFTASDEGSIFHELRNAPYIVLLQKYFPDQRTLLCYVQEKIVWVAELQSGSLSERYRLRRLNHQSISKWMFDMEVLPRPILEEEDVTELNAMFSDELNQEPSGELLVRISKHTGGGIFLQEYVLYAGQVGSILQISDGENRQRAIYTRELANNMILGCLGG